MRKYGFVACIMIAANALAISIQAKHEVVTPENADSFGISVYRIPEPRYCENTYELWISAPKHAKRAVFSLVDKSNRVLLSGSLLVQENMAEPIFEEGATYTDGTVDEWLKNSQANYGFLSNGFRGVFLCVKQEYIAMLKIRFDDRHPNSLITKVWFLEPLHEWLN